MPVRKRVTRTARRGGASVLRNNPGPSRVRTTGVARTRKPIRRARRV